MDIIVLIVGIPIVLLGVGAYVYGMYLREKDSVEDGYIAGENAFGKGFYIRLFIMCACIAVGVLIFFAFLPLHI